MGDSGSRESLVQTITICGQTIKWLDEEGNRRGKLVARTVSDERLMGVLCSTAERQTVRGVFLLVDDFGGSSMVKVAMIMRILTMIIMMMMMIMMMVFMMMI